MHQMHPKGALPLFWLLAAPLSLQAQDAAPPDQDGTPTFEVIRQSIAAPAGTLGLPTAFGRGRGRMAIGFGFQNTTRIASAADGAAGLAVGFGDARTLGMDLGLNILSVGVHEGFARRGSFSFKLFHQRPDGTGLAVGLRNFLVWGGGSDAPTQAYLVASRQYRLHEDRSLPFGTVSVTVGVSYLWAGANQGVYREVAREVASKYGPLTVLAGASAQLDDKTALFAEWTGQDLNVGVSWLVSARTGMVITPALADLTGRAPNGPRFVMGVGLPFSLR